MDKQIIKKLIIEKQKAIPEFFIIRREIQFDTHANYVLVGLRRAGKSFMMYQDAQNMMKSPGLTQENILYINFEDEGCQIFLQTVWEKYWMPISSYIQKKSH